VPLYGLLLFGGAITVNHWAGGVMLGKEGHVKMRAGTRIGVLCSQLRSVSPFAPLGPHVTLQRSTRADGITLIRRLLDAQLAEQIEAPDSADLTGHEEVVSAMMALLARDGLSM